MKSFVEFREWQDIKRLANRAANLMVELDVDVEEYLSEFVESYTDKLSEQEEEKKGWWGRMKDKFKATKWGGAIAGAASAGKEHAGLPKFKFDKAMAGLQALVGAIPAKVRGVKGQRELKTILQSLVDALGSQKPAVDAISPKPSEMGGFTSKDQAAHKAAQAPKSVSTGQDPDALSPDVRIAAAGINPDGTPQAVNASYDPSKGSWYVDDDGKVVANLPNENEAENGFFGTW